MNRSRATRFVAPVVFASCAFALGCAPPVETEDSASAASDTRTLSIAKARERIDDARSTARAGGFSPAANRRFGHAIADVAAQVQTKDLLPLLNLEIITVDPLVMDVLAERRTFADAVPRMITHLTDFLYATREYTEAKVFFGQRLSLVASMTSRLVPLQDINVIDIVAEAAIGQPSPMFFSALRQAGFERAEVAPANPLGLVPATVEVILAGALGVGPSLHDLRDTTGFEARVFGSYFAKLGDLVTLEPSLSLLVERLDAVARSAGEPKNAIAVLRQHLPPVTYARLEARRKGGP